MKTSRSPALNGSRTELAALNKEAGGLARTVQQNLEELV